MPPKLTSRGNPFPHADPKVRKRVADLYAAGLRLPALRERFAWLNSTNFKSIMDEHNVARRKTGERLSFGGPV